MNRYLALGCLGLGLMVSPLLSRMGNTAVPTNPKVGMMDIEKVLADTPAGKRANQAFDKVRKTKQDKLDADQKDLQKAAMDLEKQAAVLKPEVAKSKKEEIERKYVEIQKTLSSSEQELAKERARLISEVLAKAEPAIKEIAQKEGVTVIFEREALIYWDPAVDLTKKLEEKLQ